MRLYLLALVAVIACAGCERVYLVAENTAVGAFPSPGARLPYPLNGRLVFVADVDSDLTVTRDGAPLSLERLPATDVLAVPAVYLAQPEVEAGVALSIAIECLPCSTQSQQLQWEIADVADIDVPRFTPGVVRSSLHPRFVDAVREAYDVTLEVPAPDEPAAYLLGLRNDDGEALLPEPVGVFQTWTDFAFAGDTQFPQCFEVFAVDGAGNEAVVAEEHCFSLEQ